MASDIFVQMYMQDEPVTHSLFLSRIEERTNEFSMISRGLRSNANVRSLLTSFPKASQESCSSISHDTHTIDVTKLIRKKSSISKQQTTKNLNKHSNFDTVKIHALMAHPLP